MFILLLEQGLLALTLLHIIVALGVEESVQEKKENPADCKGGIGSLF